MFNQSPITRTAYFNCLACGITTLRTTPSQLRCTNCSKLKKKEREGLRSKLKIKERVEKKKFIKQCRERVKRLKNLEH